MSNVLGTLFQEIANAIRAKTGGTGTMKPAEFPTQIANIPVGGGSSADVRYVTFIFADGREPYVKPVAVGDDCTDIVARGLVDTPTKESTVAEVYTYSGWSLTEGGTASSSALKNVTEDRTVYAAFKTSARLYWARFYDDAGALMQESQVAYGTKATPPETTKDGSIFVAWTPSDLTIYGDTDFFGAWATAKYTLLDNPSGLPTNIYSGSFNPDGTQLILMGKNTESKTQMYVYSVVGDTYTRLFSIDMGSTSYFSYRAYSPDGTRLAISDATSNSYGVRVYDTTTTPYTLLGKTNLDYSPGALIYSPDGTKLFVGGSLSEGIRTLDATKIPYVAIDSTIPTVSGGDACVGMAYNPDKTILAILYDNQYKGAYLYDTTSFTRLYWERCYGYSIAFKPDGSQAAIGVNDGSTPRGYLININGTTINAASPNPLISTLRGMRFVYHPDGKRLIGMAGRAIGTRVYNAETTAYTSMSDMFEVEPDNVVGDIFYNKDGSRLFAIGNTTTRKMYIYNTEIDMVSK